MPDVRLQYSLIVTTTYVHCMCGISLLIWWVLRDTPRASLCLSHCTCVHQTWLGETLLIWTSLCLTCCCSQVLGEVFNCLHRAQLGSAAARAPDPGLPQVVRVPRPGSSSSLTGMATPLDPSSRQQGAHSMVQDIFGQKVQVSWAPTCS